MPRVRQVRRKVRRGRQIRGKGAIDAYINNWFTAFQSEDGELSPYYGTQALRGAQDQMKKDVTDINGWLAQAGADSMQIVAEEFDALGDDLVEQTPWHEPGPSDPPHHAAEVWDLKFYPNGHNGFTMTIYNPKPYMGFLEGGHSPQAPAGWIAAAFTLFKLNLGRRLSHG